MNSDKRIYIAAPVAVLFRPEWPSRVRQIRQLVKVPVWDPARLFGSTASWLQTWPHLLDSVSGLVLVPDADASIRAGCLREVADVLGRDRPVWLYDEGTIIPWSEALVRPVDT